MFISCSDPKSYPELLIAQIIQGQGTENITIIDMMSADRSGDGKKWQKF